ncbi:MAG TPA: hypothetical protein VKS60_02275 [Stellaceae bacterium]|nr:hypothetical protein [Stellaceae bacterium]
MTALAPVRERIVAACARHGIAAREEGEFVLISRADIRKRFPGHGERALADRAIEEIRWSVSAGAAGLWLYFAGADAEEYRLAIMQRPEPFDPG